MVIPEPGMLRVFIILISKNLMASIIYIILEVMILEKGWRGIPD